MRIAERRQGVCTVKKIRIIIFSYKILYLYGLINLLLIYPLYLAT